MSESKQQTIFVVDDDDAVRDSIAELVASIGLSAECFASAADFLKIFQADRPGCLVLDVRMPEMSGLALQQRLNDLGTRLPIIVLTGHGDIPIAVEAMKAGAVDFLQKPYREQALLDSINAALSMDSKARKSNAEEAQFDRSLDTLTGREREVLEHLLAGKTSKEISRSLQISPRTAEAHRRNLLHKFGVRSAIELIQMSASMTDNG